MRRTATTTTIGALTLLTLMTAGCGNSEESSATPTGPAPTEAQKTESKQNYEKAKTDPNIPPHIRDQMNGKVGGGAPR